MSIPALFLTASVSMTSDPAAIIDKLFDSFNRHDVAALQALYAPNARLTLGGGFPLKLTTFFRFRNGRIIEDDTIFDTGGRACE